VGLCLLKANSTSEGELRFEMPLPSDQAMKKALKTRLASTSEHDLSVRVASVSASLDCRVVLLDLRPSGIKQSEIVHFAPGALHLELFPFGSWCRLRFESRTKTHETSGGGSHRIRLC